MLAINKMLVSIETYLKEIQAKKNPLGKAGFSDVILKPSRANGYTNR